MTSHLHKPPQTPMKHMFVRMKLDFPGIRFGSTSMLRAHAAGWCGVVVGGRPLRLQHHGHRRVDRARVLAHPLILHLVPVAAGQGPAPPPPQQPQGCRADRQARRSPFRRPRGCVAWSCAKACGGLCSAASCGERRAGGRARVWRARTPARKRVKRQMGVCVGTFYTLGVSGG